MPTFAVNSAKGPRQVESNLTLEQAANICRSLPGKFPQDLAKQFFDKRRGFSDKQTAWLHVLAVSSMTQEKAESVAIEVDGIIAIFNKAKQHLKHPKIRLFVETPGKPLLTQKLVLSIAGHGAKFPGSVNVTDGGPYGQSQFFGRIRLEGVYDPAPSNRPEITEFLQEFSADPARIAGEQGRLLGRCCFCDQALSDGRSTSVGYGPICADHWDLPWGNA